MHLRLFTGTTLFPTFAVALGIFAAVGLAIFLSSHAFAQSNSAPDFGATTATRTVNEYTGTDIEEDEPWYEDIGAPVTATDADQDKLTYSIKNARSSPFFIDRFTGQLQVGRPLDYETASSHTVKVVATDPSGEKDQITVTVNVTNVDEAGEITLMWKPASGSGVQFEAKLTDPDGTSVTPTWQWASAGSQNGTYTDISGATSATFVHAVSHKYLKATATYTDAAFGGKTISKTQQIEPPSSIDSGYTLSFTAVTSGGYSCSNGEAQICIHVPRTKTPGHDLYYPVGIVYTKSGGHDRYPSDGYLSYSLAGTDAQYFDLDPVTRELLAKGLNGYETKETYLISITATDPSGRTGTLTLKVTRSGASDSPVVVGPTEMIYPENGTWQIADFDGKLPGRPLNQDVSWIIGVEPGGGDGDFFDIDDDGVLYFTQPPDFEDPADEDGDHVFRFTVEAYDGNPPNRQRPGITFYRVKVRIVNAQERLEINGPTSKDYPENGTDPVYTYTVTGNSGTVTWSLDGKDKDLFTISNGALSFINTPDYEDPFDASDPPQDRNDYLVSIIVADGDITSKIEPVRIMVTNVNEPPAFPDTEDGRRTISESAGANEDIGDPFAAEDPDGPGELLEYSLGGTDALSFSIGTYSGQLQTAAVLDFETKNSYSLTVSVSDNRDADGNGDNSADDTINVTVTVIGANEAPTIIGEATIDYVEGDTREVEDYDATDPENDTVTWSLKDVDDYNDLSIDSSAGVLTFDSPPDYEDPQNTDHQYLVTVVATDAEDNSSELDVTINITPVNDPPVITYDGNEGDQTIPYDENGTSAVATFVATDEENDSIGWSLDTADVDAALFSISNAGVLTFLNPPDYEDPKDQSPYNSYVITVEASDDTNEAVMQVTVNVTDVDEDPVVTGDTGPSVVEGNADAFGTYTAADPEGETITWEEPTGADGSLFEVSTGGKLSFKTAPDFESPGSANNSNVYQVTVNASDSTNTGSLDVTVTVVNENEAIIREGTWTAIRDYPENSDSVVATYAARDPEGEDIDWDLSGDDDDKLSISNAGILTFNTVPNFEVAADHNTDGVYAITVIASDGENQETQDVRITITNVNEAPVLTVVEEVTFAEGGTGTVTTFVVTDPDANTTITWSLTGDDAGDFNSITKPTNEPLKGDLTFVTVPDRENAADADTNNDYEITVTATDEGGLHDEMDVTIEVQDEDETPLLTGVTAKDWKENDTTAVATYNADDPEDDPITWTLEGEDRLLFTITGTQLATSEDANLSFNAAPDFEDKQDHDTDNEYEVTIKATDGTHTQTLDVVIKVTDVNETPVIEVLAPEPYAENGTGDVADFSATDPENDTIEWTLSGVDDAYFSIHADTGVLTFRSPPDYELMVDGAQKYTDDITVQASDDEFTAVLPVTVTVDDVDETPVISGETENDTISPFFDHEKNDAAPVHRFSASDPEGNAVTWELDGVDKDVLTITGGVLEFPSPPNFEDPKDSGGNNVYTLR